MSAPRLVGFALIGARAAAGSSPWRRTWPSPELAARTGDPNARTLNRPNCPHDGDIAADGLCTDCGLMLRLPDETLSRCEHLGPRTKLGFCKQCGEYVSIVLRSEDIERFWQRVDMSAGPNGCWPWMGPLNDGYGQTYVGPRVTRRRARAHRVSWAIATGKWPGPLMLVLHRPVICHNRACCNPAHLYLGTHRDNVLDKTIDGTNYEANRTHCPRGHEYSMTNTYHDPSSRSRVCRECRRERDRQRNRTRRAATRAARDSTRRVPAEAMQR